jgi:hypothetical protein
MGLANKSSKAKTAGNSGVTHYEDFVVNVRRINARTVSVTVDASPAGKLTKAVKVSFPEKEAAELRSSFLNGLTASASSSGSGQMLISQAEATNIGKRLATVLFPPDVFKLCAESLSVLAAKPNQGLRIRLVMDEPLMDLPWEYVYRPDRLENDGLSGFVLLDPLISMVRHAADDRINIEQITGRQRLTFIGTLWEGKKDGWEVWKEFDLLRTALKPVSTYILPEFKIAAEGLAAKKIEPAAIFHYAGHCDFDSTGRAFMIRELPVTRELPKKDIVYIDGIARSLAANGTRLAVMSACNSGYAAAVKPLLDAGIPVVVGVNGAVASQSTIQFCAAFYESLAVGLTVDEAVGRARIRVREWGQAHGLFDWGLYMVHMPSPRATLFPRATTVGVARRQQSIREDHAQAISTSLQLAKEIDGMNFGEIMSELSRRRVLILGRFTGRRLEVLEKIKSHLAKHSNHYIPELFTFRKPESRDLVEAIIGFAALSRFVIADLSEPKSVQSELEAIVPHFQSVPVVALINRTGREYATFSSVQRRENVVKPTVRYNNLEDLIKKLDEEVVPKAEQKLLEVRPT